MSPNCNSRRFTRSAPVCSFQFRVATSCCWTVGGTSRILDCCELRSACGVQASIRSWKAMFRIPRWDGGSSKLRFASRERALSAMAVPIRPTSLPSCRGLNSGLRKPELRIAPCARHKAYGIGICSVEEIGSLVATTQSQRQAGKLPPQPANGNYGGPKVRDRLCQIIRRHQLDPNLVKAYATDFCGVKILREATREQIENFVAHLADWAEKDRNALLCQLNSYLSPEQGAE